MNQDRVSPARPLRLWPGVVAVALQWLARFAVPAAFPDAVAFAIISGVVGGLVVLIWWLFFSRTTWTERLGFVALLVAAPLAASLFIHESIATGMMGMLFPIYVIPGLSLALVAGAVVGRRLSAGLRRAVMAAAILLASGGWTLVRTGGITGYADSDFHWRWSETPEDRLLAQTRPDATALRPIPVPPDRSAAWPGFRGPQRDGIVRGTRIDTDWSKSPPVELWRRPVGPGWSSFAVHGAVFYTQEQRGEDEVVTCYNLQTGQPAWQHRDAVRFWESNAGAGPRATPTVSGDRVYTFGATGLLNALDAANGSVVWSRDTAADAGKKAPDWGFASSPLVVGDLVIIAATGTLVGYERATGKPRWFGPKDGGSYSSPHLLTIDGVAQVLLMSKAGATSVAPADGSVLWQHPWPGFGIVQPAVVGAGDLLISTGDRIGTRRLEVRRSAEGWKTEERWTSIRFKPYFNDFVLHDGHAFGFDSGILACLDLGDGRPKWKGGRYGHGQLVLLADQAVLLVLSEQGELALVRAASDQFTELARIPALAGKTWNHPVLAGDLLLVRNGQEMAAFRVTLAGSE